MWSWKQGFLPRAYNKQPVTAGFLFILINKGLISGWHAAERKGERRPGLAVPPPSCCSSEVGLRTGARQPPPTPKPCPGPWTQLGHGPCPGEGQGGSEFIAKYLPTHRPSQQVYFSRGGSQTQTCTVLLEGTEGRREETAAAARGEVLAAAKSIHSFCASISTKVELSAAYLKAEGEGWGSGTPSYPFSVPSPLPFLGAGVLQVKSNHGLE